MKRKTKKRILLYVIAAILVVCGIFAYQTNKRSAEKKAQKEAMKTRSKQLMIWMEKRSVYRSERPVIFMHPIMKVIRQVL